MLEIKKYPDPILKQISTEAPLLQSTYELAKMMIESMESKKGIGLSAVQVGIPIRLIIVKLSSGSIIKMANPKIVERKGKPTLKEEGCLSFAGAFTYVRRHTTLTCEYYNLDLNQQVRRTFIHRDAQVIQHEIDHLDGKTLVDILPEGLVGAFLSKVKQW